ncbi:hypothetical protein FA13DRAFT_1619132 [Coprinellus micaceus]|uniref:MATH domain-containing protein n=1 Tax=Coprinellus micaceus TaxID=71717 RepID=A0A4Y7U1S0_COPMI|nr:hypothetical protein FA13DRAFT_1619132 [Coprinellus micaceus]
MDVDSEYQETTSVTLEWTLRGLKALFDSTRGDLKSKVTRSPRFGNGRWQILFYANAGSQKDGGDGYVSLYLSCEPTSSEKEAALTDNGRWHREGTYKFCFELRDVEKKILYNVKEAVNHSFSYKTANWGWAQFARRDSIYYQSPNVKAQDAFVIVCTVISTPVTPSLPPPVARYSIPRPLLDTIGSLLDDPLYSDVQFIVGRQGSKSARRIWASKRILSRADYFATMFNSNFAEGGMGLPTVSRVNLETPRQTSISLMSPSGSTASSILNVMDEFEDSDNEDDDVLETRISFGDKNAMSSTTTEEMSMILAADTHVVEPEHVNDESLPPDDSPLSSPINPAETVSSKATEQERLGDEGPRDLASQAGKPTPMTVMITDVAYSTYKAILYYIYTDIIVFAPLSSSFSNSKLKTPPRTPLIRQNSTASESSSGYLGPKRSNGDPPTTRAEWIAEWMKDNPARPAPCSAKAVYRVADKLDLGDLKERASKHIFKSLTVDNIAYEVFSPFAAVFEEIRKASSPQFFLNHWHEIRASESMRTVWQQIRSGRHPGFEEVWPLIAQSLEFKPSAPPQQASTKSTGAAQTQ